MLLLNNSKTCGERAIKLPANTLYFNTQGSFLAAQAILMFVFTAMGFHHNEYHSFLSRKRCILFPLTTEGKPQKNQ